jgi:hypothetical protein
MELILVSVGIRVPHVQMRIRILIRQKLIPGGQHLCVGPLDVAGGHETDAGGRVV